MSVKRLALLRNSSSGRRPRAFRRGRIDPFIRVSNRRNVWLRLLLPSRSPRASGSTFGAPFTKRSAASETYLVQLLSDFANPSAETRSALDRPVAFLLHDAMAAAGAERFRRLQSLGDGVLYGLGFFGQAVEGADRRYYIHVGASAYGHAAQMLRAGQSRASGPDVLDELARKFDGFTAVIAMVADFVMAQSARGHQGMLKLYERWLKTGSAVLEKELGERGIMPLAKQGGVH
jgi:hypothetical protein